MLTQLSVGNFKSWKKIDKMRLAPITGLFGTNSSGKTSILQLLLMMKQTIESSDRAQVLEFGDEKSLTNLGSFRETVYGHAKPGSMSFGLRWNFANMLELDSFDDSGGTGFGVDHIGLHCEVSDTNSGKLAVTRMEYNIPGHKFVMTQKSINSGKYELVSAAVPDEDTGMVFGITPRQESTSDL